MYLWKPFFHQIFLPDVLTVLLKAKWFFILGHLNNYFALIPGIITIKKYSWQWRIPHTIHLYTFSWNLSVSIVDWDAMEPLDVFMSGIKIYKKILICPAISTCSKCSSALQRKVEFCVTWLAFTELWILWLWAAL